MLVILYEVNHDYDYNYDAALPSAITQIRQTKIYMDLDGDWFARVIFEVTWPATYSYTVTVDSLFDACRCQSCVWISQLIILY